MWCDRVQFCTKILLAFLRLLTVRVVFLCGVSPCNFFYENTFGPLTTFHFAGGFLIWCDAVQIGVKVHLALLDFSLCGWLSYVV
jgi:hypothetical protein